MVTRAGNGKRAAIRSPTPDSSSESSPSAPEDAGHPKTRKRSRIASVFKESLLPQTRSKLKGAARGSLTAARKESKAGRKISARGKAPSGSRSATTTGGFHVGSIVWITQGVVSSEVESDTEVDALSPAYCFSPGVSLEMQDVAALKQYQCAVMDYAHGFYVDYSWSLEKIESMLSGHFPHIFAYFKEHPIPPDSDQQSHWLVCTKGKRYSKYLVVFSGNEKPTTSDLAMASKVQKRVGLQEVILILATVRPIPSSVVQSWRRSTAFFVEDQETEAGPSTIEPLPSQRTRYKLRSRISEPTVESEDEVENVIDLTVGRDSDNSPATPPRADTPPVMVNEVSNSFSSSFRFEGNPDSPNPWYEG